MNEDGGNCEWQIHRLDGTEKNDVRSAYQKTSTSPLLRQIKDKI